MDYIFVFQKYIYNNLFKFQGEERCFVEAAIKPQVTLGDYENPDFITYNKMLKDKNLPPAV